MAVFILKLTTGEELIADKDDRGSLRRPRVVHMMQTQGGMSMGLIPWIITAPDDSVIIDEKFIIACISAPAEIEKAYLQQTSGLAIAQTLMEGGRGR